MIGEITDAHTRQDIVDAKALGFDGFAMNFGNDPPNPQQTLLTLNRSVCILVEQHC